MQNAPREHSAIPLTCIKLQSVFKTYVLYIFEWPLKTGFTIWDHTTVNAVKHVLSGHSETDQKFGFQDRLSLTTGHKYCRMPLLFANPEDSLGFSRVEAQLFFREIRSTRRYKLLKFVTSCLYLGEAFVIDVESQ